MLLGILKFIFAFAAISSLLLFAVSLIYLVTNPQLDVNEEGKVYEKNRNMRVWLGLITAFFWSLLISLL